MDSPSLSGPPLCSACQRIFAPGSFELWQSRHNQDIDELQGSHMVLHSKSLQERERSRAAGCWLCDVLVKNFRYLGPPDSLFYTIERDDEDSLLYIITFYTEEQSQGLKPGTCFLELIAQRSDMSFSLFDNAAKSRSCAWTGQPEVLQLALDWLRICQESHNCMAQPEKAWYPSRLLDVSRDNSVRLAITADEHISGHYVTLSHCWGTVPFLVMTPDNISEFKAGRPAEDFPLTFQEVFAVTKYLGIRYLWIDSYCIMQGDSKSAHEDWNREAQQMCNVYTNSFLNIGSAHSDGPNGGLFHKRAIEYHHPLIKWQPTSGDDEQLFEWEVAQNKETSSDVKFRMITQSLGYCVMSTRAWVVQEIVLSPRMLTFTNEQLFWQCAETYACEVFPLQASITFDEIQDENPFWVLEFDHRSPPFSKGTSSIELRKLRARWFKLFEQYSYAKLSYPEKDFVKALDGIGQRFAQLTGQAYRYGILEGTFPRALLWDTRDHLDPRHRRERGPSGLAPSWHWASQRSTTYVLSESYSPYGPVPELDLVLAHTYLWEDGIPFDSKTAKDATLNAQGPALICIGRLLRIRSIQIEKERESTARLDLALSYDLHSNCYIDTGKVDDFENFRPSELRFLPLLVCDKAIQGLVLCTDKNGSCKRIGYIRFDFNRAFHDIRSFPFLKKWLQEKPRLIVIE